MQVGPLKINNALALRVQHVSIAYVPLARYDPVVHLRARRQLMHAEGHDFLIPAPVRLRLRGKAFSSSQFASTSEHSMKMEAIFCVQPAPPKTNKMPGSGTVISLNLRTRSEGRLLAN